MNSTGRPSLRHLVDRAEREPHAVGEGQVLVDEGPGRERRGVELPRREQDLPVLPVDPVAVVVHRDEVVVGADLLQLAEGQQQRVPVPEPHVLDGRRVGPDVRQREVGLAAELAGLHAVQPPGLAGGEDVVPEVGRLAGQLGRRDEEASASPAGRGRARGRPRPRSRRSPEPVQRQLPPQPRRSGRRRPRAPRAPPRPAARAARRAGRCSWRRPAGRWSSRAGSGISTSQSRRRGQEEQHRQQDGQVDARRRLDAQSPAGPARGRRAASRPGSAGTRQRRLRVGRNPSAAESAGSVKT